ncbi:hypothetical protein A3J56_02185 [Candidatus Giovannonibacteria bacterium RIFCSPHIGHO2_02_FULL_46_20]|uniref:Uncharacterized protein n=1 Tax=Candidatus Giovannonibacteria bacterium RIFCSPHIGHO2_02_FULL_46_20 TaxID=1798338 RepID=A0A1F5WDV1_9BACT|nr:MAG: hypothetical protein A3J56_02185 [Candidatus Giovannonibacteria bacterium RIFCSPHIGHO2_02_FULL_46_20]
MKNGIVFARKLWHWLVYGDWYGNNINNGYHKHFHKVVLYRLLGFVTIAYVGLWFFLFHKGLYEIPYELRFFWMLTLFSYAVLNQVYRWTGIHNSNHWGEFFAWLVIAAFSWMNGVNLYYKIEYNLPFQRLPEGVFESTCEAFALVVCSNIFTALYYRKNKLELKQEPQRCGE